MKKMHLYSLALVASLMALLPACADTSLNLQVRFDDVRGLQQGGAVYFERNIIGEVEQISYTSQGDYLVDIAIQPEFKNAVTEDSTFFVGRDPGPEKNTALIILQREAGGRILEDGSIVQGSAGLGFDQVIKELSKTAGAAEEELHRALEHLKKSLDAASQQLNTELEYSLGELSRQLQEFMSEVQKVPESDEVKEFEKSVKQFADEFNEAREDVRDHIRDEVIPQLRIELERLRKKLEKEDRQEELQEIDKRVEEMTVV